ncbi:hypothetical protein [Acetobacter pasteurianus]
MAHATDQQGCSVVGAGIAAPISALSLLWVKGRNPVKDLHEAFVSFRLF